MFGRVLCPDTKVKTFEERSRYAFNVASSDSLIEVYQALDCPAEKLQAIQKRMNHKIASSIGRNTEICFYDVTNYYFEIEQSDEDILDKDGKVIQKGFRKRGVSKEKKSEPIAQMELF